MSRKKSHNADEKLKRGFFGIFQHPFFRKTSRKLKEETLQKNFFPNKFYESRKNWKGGPFCLSRYGMLRGKRGKNYFQFRTIKFRGTSENYFGQIVGIGKKVTIIVAFYFMKPRIKTKSHLYSLRFQRKALTKKRTTSMKSVV